MGERKKERNRWDGNGYLKRYSYGKYKKERNKGIKENKE